MSGMIILSIVVIVSLAIIAVIIDEMMSERNKNLLGAIFCWGVAVFSVVMSTWRYKEIGVSEDVIISTGLIIACVVAGYFNFRNYRHPKASKWI